ncbi:unnamed protein product [Discula destructiva]
MNTLNLGGATSKSGLSISSTGPANANTGLSVGNLGSISTNAGVDIPKGLGGITGGLTLSKGSGNVFTSGSAKESHEDVSHQMISSLFIGPRAENLKFFRQNIDRLLNEVEKARKSYYPEDGDFITQKIQNSEEFQNRTASVADATKALGELLGQHSIPFWSPRYQGHMCMDMSMPALLGYFATLLYNPNNVAFEASPLSTLAEIEVGKQLCGMFGYNVEAQIDMKPDPAGPDPWGHVTADGTIANLESMWAARNLKFYPLSLRQAMEGPLSDVAKTFRVTTVQGREDLFVNLSTWELLNLRMETILDLPDRLNRDYGISSKYMEKIVNEFGIQSRGKDVLEREFGIEKPAQCFLSSTKHYSWPKGAAICGIGSENVVSVPVDHGARLDIRELSKKLKASLQNQQPVYAVVAIIGSTEEGAVDSLSQVLALRDHFQEQGLSFVVHADAAWGGYFASMIPSDYVPGSDRMNIPLEGGSAAGFVPDLCLRVETQHDLWSLRKADTITVDPHKAGYIPYPAGGLCYKDGRMRHLLTWTAPYLSQGSIENIGIYGLEGSKPGASAVSTYMANNCIGLDEKGYGALHGEVSFTSGRLSAQWAAMTDDCMSFTCVPLNMLPSEMAEDSSPQSIEAEKEWIRANILSANNAQIAGPEITSPGGDSAMTLIRKLGSDLNINAFACNFRYNNGQLNDDPDEANYFMRQIMENLSVNSADDDPAKIPLYLSSTEFSPALYGDCLKNFKRRLGLKDGPQELFVLRNVVMSPWPTEKDFIGHLADIFKETAENAVKICRERNEITESGHTFLVQGDNPVFFLHKPSFHAPNHRRQTLLEVELPAAAKDWYLNLKARIPEEVFAFETTGKVDLNEAIETLGTLVGSIKVSACVEHSGFELSDLTIQITKPWHNRQLNGMYLASDYPSDRMPFLLYGRSTECNRSVHIDHALLKAPNIQLTATDIGLELSPPLSLPFESKRPLVLMFDSVRENTMQPFPDSNKKLTELSTFFFRKGNRFSVSVWKDPTSEDADGQEILSVWESFGRNGSDHGLVGRGTVTLGNSVFVDAEYLNHDPYKREDALEGWTDEFKKIGKASRK